jgi:hypothetical protein
MLQYSKWDGRVRRRITYNSKGDFNRLREFVRNTEGFLVSKGLFIPFETAWKAVKQFIEADGASNGSRDTTCRPGPSPIRDELGNPTITINTTKMPKTFRDGVRLK